MARKVLVAFGDTHACSRLGLMNPDVVLYDEDERGELVAWTPTPTAVQRWLWGHYQQDMARALEIAGDDELVVVHNGDLTWGAKYMSELVSTSKADQLLIAAANLAPWLAHPNVRAMRLVHGTGSHAFGEATAEQLVAEQLRARFPEREISALRHGLLEVAGVGVDVAHHGPTPGVRAWTAGNQLRHYTRSLLWDDLSRGVTPPRVVIRSHYHTYTHVVEVVQFGEREWEADAYVLPAYCGLTEFGVQATRSAYLIGCGLLVLELEDGRLVGRHPLHRVVDLRRREAL